MKAKGLIKEYNPNLDALKAFLIAGTLSVSSIWGTIKLTKDKEPEKVKEERVDIGGGISVKSPAPVPVAPVLSPKQVEPVEENTPVEETTPVVEGIKMPDGTIFVPSPVEEAPKGKAQPKGKAKGKPVFEN